MKKLSIYLAAPLFNGAERKSNEEMKAALEKEFGDRFLFYLPQENAGRLQALLAAHNRDEERIRRFLFSSDVLALKECDVMVANITGRVPDEGVAWEMGYFSALGKPIIVFSDDDRCFENNHINLMLQYYSGNKRVSDITGVIEALKVLFK